MSPIDDTPHAGEIMQPPERRIPQPLPGQASDEPLRGNSRADELGEESNVAHRPPLPRHAQRHAADGEAEPGEPAIEHRRVRDDGGAKSFKKQRG